MTFSKTASLADTKEEYWPKNSVWEHGLQQSFGGAGWALLLFFTLLFLLNPTLNFTSRDFVPLKTIFDMCRTSHCRSGGKEDSISLDQFLHLKKDATEPIAEATFRNESHLF